MKKLILLLSLFFFLMSSAQERKEINTDTKTENIEKQISDLQEKIKVLEEQQLDKSKETENTYKNNMDFVEKVEGFYERSWNKLINLIGWVATMTGIIVPISIGWLQNRNFDRLETNGEELQKKIEKSYNDFQNKIVEIEQKFKNQIDDYDVIFRELLNRRVIENKQLFENELNKAKQMFSLEISQVNSVLQENFAELMARHSLVVAELNVYQRNFDKAFYNLGKSIRFQIIPKSLRQDQDNILFVIELMEGIIKTIKGSSSTIFKGMKLKEELINTLKSIISMKLEAIPTDRIQNIITFIEDH